jgi:hypothetical protein
MGIGMVLEASSRPKAIAFDFVNENHPQAWKK